MNFSEDKVRSRQATNAAFEKNLPSLAESEPRTMRLDEHRGGVILLSGGLDSATVLAIAIAEGLDCYALTIDYGQRHHAELAAARRTALDLGATAHRVIEVPASEIGASIPATYVPARNTILLSLALAWAEVLEINNIYIGANARDYSGYPDCRPEYLVAFEKLANLATKASIEGSCNFRIHAPIINLTKAETIGKGMELGVNFGLTHSCYDPAPDGRACGTCEACILRRQGFQEAGINDPTEYAGDE